MSPTERARVDAVVNAANSTLYVRIGFGAWPRSCIDNPDLPMLHGLVLGLMVGLLIIPVGVPVWLGWLIIRLRRSMKRYWAPSTAAFVLGIAAMVAAQRLDPWGFWSWVWD
jgi:cytochrome c biogenesis protein CcdA